ncbi:MAG: SLC13 family permease, partial [Bacillota bacterium]
ESSIKEKENKESANTGLNISVLVMLIIMLLILFLFIMEPVRIDLIALLIPVILVVLNKWTFIDKSEALSGFSNSATITALAMFILSEGIQNSGLVQLIENKIASITGDSEVREVGFVSGISGIVSGFLYNTPVVAIFIPMVTDLARNTDISPSKLLIPLSYAATMGGLLTIVGSGVNLLASEISASLINRPFSFFEFTHLGILILITGVIYFISVGRHLLPDHVQPEEDLVDEYEMKPFIAEVVVEVDSSLIGQSINETLEQSDLDMDLIMLTRDGKEFVEPLQPKTLQAGDKLIIRSDREALLQLMRQKGLSFLLEPRVSEEELESPSEGNLIETVITSDSIFAGKTLIELNFMERYDCSVLAIRRGSELSHYKLDEIELQPGDVLLMLTNESTLERFRKRRDIIVAREMEQTDYSQEKIPYVVGIMIGVILLGVSEIIPLSIASLMWVIAMVMTGCVKPPEMYEAVNWQIIILMAGLIPLGSAMETTGTANFLAGQILKITGALPPLIILALFYLFTSVVTNIVSNRASIVMMVPVAVDAALRLGVEPFSFIVAVSVAASTAYLTPIGNQVHLLVYGPGGYKFGDYFKVGFPLQLLLTVVVTAGIVFFWGI